MPRDAPLEYLGPLGCSVQTGVGSVLAVLRPEPGTSLVVFGAGPVGMCAVLGAVLAGCNPIIAVDLRPGRLQLAREFGATYAVNSTEDDPVVAIRDLTGGGAAFSLETTAVPAVLRAAVDCLGIRGRCGTVGVAPAGAEVAFEMNTLLFGRSVQGILLGERVPREFVPELVDLHLVGSCRSTGSAGSTTWNGSTRPSPPPRARGKCSSRSSRSANLLRPGMPA